MLIPVLTRYSRIISEMHWLCSYPITFNTSLHQQAINYSSHNIYTNIMDCQVFQDNSLIE
uniref:Uncharacterized protein n=1 Tax=Bangia fuscopurpurea TaxID=101920 RepID=A0A0F6VXN4_BANFU|nr:hypothetical protein 263 [Bangia fuscopurpurea]